MSTSIPDTRPSASLEVPLDQADYADARLECDVVMKGGITSGVVYPLAVCELARTYRFRSIGGTSAGAIAAAATAAAELGRRNGGRDGKDPGHGFRELARLPSWLGGSEEGADRSHLFALFQPDRATDALFDVATAKLRGRSTAARLIHRFPAAAVLGALIGVSLALLGTQTRPALAGGLLVAFGLAIAGALAVGIPAWLLARQARREIPRNGFGLCSGNGPDVNDRTGMPPALTPWLANLLNDLAGKPREAGPVTFGDLWNLGEQKSGETGEQERDIDLLFMTTNLTHGRPYQFPLTSRLFYYDPDELARYFPAWVLEPMNQAARRIKREKAEERARRAARKAAEADGADPMADDLADAADPCRADRPDRPLDPVRVARAQARWDRLLPLPASADLPIVLGARLSLSFPVLFSALPLYAVDYASILYDEERAPEVCWFSDGGICSNFPVHFFDAVLPARPTFGINLVPFPEGRTRNDVDQFRNSWLPCDNSDAIGEWFTRLPTAGWSSLAGFAGLIITTMQNWVDNTQLRVPGYRDRVAHVLLDEELEGGLNLNMPPRTIRDLGRRGQLAARELARRYDPLDVPTDTRLTWDNHRWVRFRSSLQLVDELLREIKDQYRVPDVSGRSYADLVARARDAAPRSYALRSVKRAQLVEQALADLGKLAFLNGRSPLFEKGTPRPLPELRIRPRL